jgi:hypothetical protein
VLVVLALVAFTGVFGVRDGAYRKRGVLLGLAILAGIVVLLFTNTVR